MRLVASEGVPADAAPALVDLVVLHGEPPAVEGAVVVVPLQAALGLHLANGWSARGLQEDGVTSGQSDDQAGDQSS